MSLVPGLQGHTRTLSDPGVDRDTQGGSHVDTRASHVGTRCTPTFDGHETTYVTGGDTSSTRRGDPIGSRRPGTPVSFSPADPLLPRTRSRPGGGPRINPFPTVDSGGDRSPGRSSPGTRFSVSCPFRGNGDTRRGRTRTRVVTREVRRVSTGRRSSTRQGSCGSRGVSEGRRPRTGRCVSSRHLRLHSDLSLRSLKSSPARPRPSRRKLGRSRYIKCSSLSVRIPLG